MNESIIQPKDLFDLLGIKNHYEAERVMNYSFSLLANLKIGDTLKTGNLTLSKIDQTLIHIETSISSDVLLDEMEKRRIIKLPI